jgi:chemotaxis protein CheZ
MQPSPAEFASEPALAPEGARPSADAGNPPELYQQLGHITRQLHDTLRQLGLMPRLQEAADGLPDARSRLQFVANKTADAANKVLNSVDAAKGEHGHISSETRRLAEMLQKDPVKAVASGAVMNFVHDVERSTARIDSHLTDIMMAQDFHDLTGQVVSKVVRIASDLEESLVKLLVQAAPHELDPALQATVQSGEMPATAALHGPVTDPERRSDVVKSQSEVDDLLASLGF